MTEYVWGLWIVYDGVADMLGMYTDEAKGRKAMSDYVAKWEKWTAPRVSDIMRSPDGAHSETFVTCELRTSTQRSGTLYLQKVELDADPAKVRLGFMGYSMP